ncbi:MAG: CrcB family protein [Halobacteriales archaeon]|nr:CrcB family protein [Halobacteriales archaeon]
MPNEHPLRTVEALVLVAIGGFAGSNLRYLVGLLVPGAGGTLLVNVLGSLLLGVLLYAGLFGGTLSRETRTVLATGVLASFTTYSTFALETASLSPGWLLANVVGSYALAFAAVLAGRAVARRLVGEAER